MNEILLSKQSEVNLNSPQEVTYTSQSYFDTITKRLDSWHAKQQAIKEQKAQLTKSFLLTDEDPIDGVTRVYQTSITLLRTFNKEQADVHALELPELALVGESEVNSYVS